ncbi:serine arginine repetitive matrix 1 isoform 1 [Schistosoma japonicum]|uniref:Serine arginine repetitive matrix 1 isoform 1 n=1 Tax=Schistosoma japonicum TaxID=6182 RepID=A0A4Z2D8V3_SCHJA|nr:serine arginine repetitive matrix 1 isoform 1 [Schistosoma japonicum]TNN12849.1 serine arginine repetitive matrix 1 isoform 1 [Schistosoma japonicum]
MKNQSFETEEAFLSDPSLTDNSSFIIYPRKEVYYDFHDTTSYDDGFWFSLPLDLRILENMSVVDYLRQYVHVSSRKNDLYQRIYNRWCHGCKFPIEKLNYAFEDIVPVQIPNGCYHLVLNLIHLKLEDYQTIDYETFCCLCIAAERFVLYKIIKDSNIPIPSKNILEMIEFQRLQCQYMQLNMNENIKHFLDLLLL